MAKEQKKDEKTKELIAHKAAEFFARESDRTSLITVTHAEIYARGKEAKIFIVVFPTEKEADALAFSKRRRSDLRAFLKENTRLIHIPFLDVEIDEGEKNRQKIDTISLKKTE